MTDYTASKEDAMKHRLPINYRDSCSALLIPLNICRHKNLYMPWECTDERHTYEKCQYEDMLRRMKVLAKQKAAAAEEE